MLVVALVYAIRILRDVKDISKVVKEESEKIKDDVAHFRASAYEEGAKVKHLFGFLSALFTRKETKSRKQKSSVENDNKK